LPSNLFNKLHIHFIINKSLPIKNQFFGLAKKLNYDYLGPLPNSTAPGFFLTTFAGGSTLRFFPA